MTREIIVTVKDGTKMSRDEYHSRISEMEARGVRLRDIADWAGKTPGAVCVTLKKQRAALYPHLAEHIRDLKMQHHNRLLHIYREAISAWHRSCDREHTTSKVKKPSGGGKGDEMMERTVKESHGDTSYLMAAMHALNQIAELWPGMKARQEIDLGISVEVVNKMSQEDRRNLAESMARMSQAELRMLESEQALIVVDPANQAADDDA